MKKPHCNEPRIELDDLWDDPDDVEFLRQFSRSKSWTKDTETHLSEIIQRRARQVRELKVLRGIDAPCEMEWKNCDGTVKNVYVTGNPILNEGADRYGRHSAPQYALRQRRVLPACGSDPATLPRDTGELD